MTIKTVGHFRYLGDSVPAIIIMVSLFVFPSRRRDRGEVFFFKLYNGIKSIPNAVSSLGLPTIRQSS